MKERDWRHIDSVSLEYHKKQWSETKESTKFFYRFIQAELEKCRLVVDLGCGAGATTAFLADKKLSADFVGIDISSDLIEIANCVVDEKKILNLSFETDDILHLNKRQGVDMVVSQQTLSWLSNIDDPLVQIFEKLSPHIIAISSLFYEGEISCKIEVTEHLRENPISFYNVYSIPAVDRLAQRYGYKVSKIEPFKIGIDLPQPSDPNFMGTYTKSVLKQQNVGELERIQISGPLLMNWYLLMLTKITE